MDMLNEEDVDIDEVDSADRDRMIRSINNLKPCFETSSSQIFYQNHLAAQAIAAAALKINANDPNINHFIINTGISEDGRTIADAQDDTQSEVVKSEIRSYIKDKKWVNKFFNVGENKYEIGIVMEFTDYRAPSFKDLDGKPDILKEILKYNEAKGTLRKYKELLVGALSEYCSAFWGENEGSTYRVDGSSVTEFIPMYDGSKIRVDGGEILSMPNDEILKYLSNRQSKSPGKVNAVQAKGGEKVKTRDENGKPQEVTAKSGEWIINNNRVISDMDFNKEFEKTKDGSIVSKEENDKEVANNTKPRLGFKIGYSIVY